MSVSSPARGQASDKRVSEPQPASNVQTSSAGTIRVNCSAHSGGTRLTRRRYACAVRPDGISASTTACDVGLLTWMRSPTAPASCGLPLCRKRDAGTVEQHQATRAPFCTIEGRANSLAASGRPAPILVLQLHADRLFNAARNLAMHQRRMHSGHVYVVGVQHAASGQPCGGDRSSIVSSTRPPIRRLTGSIASPVTDSIALNRPLFPSCARSKTTGCAVASSGTVGDAKSARSISQSADAPTAFTAARAPPS